MKLEQMVNEAKSFLGIKYFENLHIEYKKVEDSSYLKISRHKSNVLIEYGELSSLFRGLTYIKEMKDRDDYEKEFHKSFRSNCWMIDVSRNAVMRKEQLKRIIMMMSLFGMNRFMLYTEDTFEVKKYPYFGYLRGRYTVEDLKELVEYGESLGVELVPCIETLDHLARVLRYDAFFGIKDGPSNLNVGEEETYVFIEELIKTCREAFKTNIIHLGMDESMGMGLGRYLLQHGYNPNRIEMFNNHLRRVNDICKKYDFHPIIWSDMYFRLLDQNANYYTDKELTDEVINIIPKDIDLVYWDYYHDDRKTYETMLKKHLKLSNNILFAGGAWNWATLAPYIKIALERGKTSLEVMIENKVKDVMVTTWGDYGAECSNFVALPCLAIYSLFDYEGKYNKEHLESLFEAVCNEKLDNFKLLDLVNEPKGENKISDYNCGRYFLYQDPLLGLFDHAVKDSFSKQYESYLPLLKKAIKDSAHYKYLFEVTYDLINVLKDKVDLGKRLREAYKKGDTTTLKDIKDNTLPRIMENLAKYEVSFEKRWTRENKPFGYDVIDGRLGYLKNRLNNTHSVLSSYLNGEISKIEELEEEILPYSTAVKEDELFVGPWQYIVTPCEI